MKRIVTGAQETVTGRGRFAALVIIGSYAMLAGCANLAPMSATPAAPVAAPAADIPGLASSDARNPFPAASRPPAATPPAAPRPFAEVTKDAAETKGLFHVWQKDDKTWLEIAPEQFDRLYSFTVNLSRGLGEKWFFGGMRYESEIVSLRKIGNQVQLIARNQRFFARPATPEARAVAESFADSLLASAPIASLPHPARKSILIDASTLLLTDIAGANGDLERTFRQPYSFDARNSAITQVRATPEQTSFNVSANYALARITQPPVNSAQPYAALPSTVPDVRSLLLGLYYNFAKLPDVPMRPRLADDRLGFNTATRYDFGNDNAVSPRQTYVRRWRIEKADPDSPVSDARQPVVFWLDRTIPERYRATVIAGVLEWNKAFERIGVRNALEVKVQPEDADWDSYDARHSTIRWMTTARPIFGGVAQSVVDPRSGEILNSGIGIDPVRLRNRRFQRVEMVLASSAPGGAAARSDALCLRADFAAEEVGFALDLLEARGLVDPDSPEAEEFVLSDLKETVMHEVGHALGLTHNFRASTVYSQAQLSDAEFTRANGIAGSVMEYNPTNIALAGEKQGAYSMVTLGPYDYWAIEFGYKPIAPEKEREELLRIAARSSEPQLAFAQDFETATGLDPEAMQGDLGNSSLEFASRRFVLAQELWDRWQGRPLKDGDSYSALRRNITRGLGQVYKASAIAAGHIGGMSILRDHAGSTRAPLNPVPMEKQREALRLLESRVFNADNFRFKPEFLRRLSLDYFERDDGFDAGVGAMPRTLDYSLPEQVLGLQRGILTQVMSDGVARRLLDSESRLDDPAKALKLSELYATLYAAIWSELKSGNDISVIRRNLQREHANRIVASLLRPSGSTPADARSLLRSEARTLRNDIAQALRKKKYSAEAEAHLSDTLATLEEALKAPLLRQGI
ncbi:MAG: zinc-dependent metalloprotease [Betaproteobacteria bacterium]